MICGHVDSGKSTTTGRLIFELGGLPERDLEKLKQEKFGDGDTKTRERGLRTRVTIASGLEAIAGRLEE